MNNLANLPLKPWKPSKLIWVLSGCLFLFAAKQEVFGEKESITPTTVIMAPNAEEHDVIVPVDESILIQPELESEEVGISIEEPVAALEDDCLPEESVEVPAESSTDSEEVAKASEPEKSVAQPLEYKVRWGDSLWKISKEFNIDSKTLAEANGLSEKKYLRPGQILMIPPGKGVYHTVQRGESLWQICRGYGVSMDLVQQENEIDDASQLKIDQKIFLPGARSKKATNQFAWPLRGRLTSGYGYRQHPMGGQTKFHCGIDIAAPTGRTIQAARDGTVIFSGRRGALGLAVLLKHDNNYTTVYGHASKLLVSNGQRVKQGDAIARVGSTGRSTGSHLHFEIRKSGRAVNPRPLLP